MTPRETDVFLGGTKVDEDPGCMRSKPCCCCCGFAAVLGALLVALGIVVIVVGPGVLEDKIQETMALTPGSDRLESWLRPPVQPYLWGYAFHVTNPEAVLRGRKPVLEEKGPYVYKAVTIKDSPGSMEWHDADGTLTYRPRKIYTYEPSLSGEGLDPYTDVVTVPNIPLWTGLNAIRYSSGFEKDIGRDLVVSTGRGTPFVDVTFDGLLWGYADDLPCLRLKHPSGCAADEDDPFGSDDAGGAFGDDPWGDDDDWGGKRRKKRQAAADVPAEPKKKQFANLDLDPKSEYFGLSRPKAEYVGCDCEWGLFRDRNVTMRKPVRFHTGEKDLGLKGVVTEFDGADTLGWWEEGSQCDAVGGQDVSTLPPSIAKEDKLDIFFSVMCRSIPITYEKEVEHAEILTYRFVPPPNAMGSHTDPDPERRNEANSCYCMREEGYKCHKSGVLNLSPCKGDKRPPLAVSYPHFYQADPSYVEAVEGLSPEKEKHQFFMDVVPEFGYPLAIRPRFQLNVVVGSGVDPGWEVIADMRDEIVVPFLWAQDGFDEPSEKMADDIRFGLDAPEQIPLLAAVVCFVVGGIVLLLCLAYFIWRRRT